MSSNMHYYEEKNNVIQKSPDYIEYLYDSFYIVTSIIFGL